MAGITLAQAEEKLKIWMDALDALANVQSYSIGGRSFTRASLPDVREQIEWWDRKVKRLSRRGGGISVVGAEPHGGSVYGTRSRGRRREWY